MATLYGAGRRNPNRASALDPLATALLRGGGTPPVDPATAGGQAVPRDPFTTDPWLNPNPPQIIPPSQPLPVASSDPADGSYWSNWGAGGQANLAKSFGGTVSTTALPGWSQQNWDDPGMQTTKYKAGRILSKYPGTDAGIQQAWTEIKAAFPGATFDGKDKIDFGDGYGPIDVLAMAGPGEGGGGHGWWWGPAGGETGSPSGVATTSSGGIPVPSFLPSLDDTEGFDPNSASFGNKLIAWIMQTLAQQRR